jgi:hypothetical protein
MKNQASKLMLILNIPRMICDHVVGENHHLHHRLKCGVMLMTVGVLIANVHADIMLINIVSEGFGYTLHAVGAMPILETVMKVKEVQDGSHRRLE